MPRPRVVFLTDRSRKEVPETADTVRETIAAHAEIVAELAAESDSPPDGIEADFAIVIGGDGTLIHQARRLASLDLPLIGVNVGRLGFLAEFDVDTLREHASAIFSGRLPVRQHMMLRAQVRGEDGALRHDEVAVNDCAISAGEPFKMIELRLRIDETEGPILTGDGVIVATPTGSTAYNISAGGPIVHPKVDAMVITPLAAHSLGFRSIVLAADSVLEIRAMRTNPGTALVCDGQVLVPLGDDDRVTIRRHGQRAKFVINPDTTYWTILLDKLRWAAPPSYRERGQ